MSHCEKVYWTHRERGKDSLHKMATTRLQDVRIGKYMELVIGDSERDVDEVVKEMCEKLLANTVIEDYRYEIEEVVSQ